MDFRHDFAEIIKDELSKMNIQIDSSWDDYKICMKYYDLRKRHVFGTKYKINYSNIVSQKIDVLSEKEKSAFRDIEKRLMDGEDLFHYFSNLILDTRMNKSDFLLKNWSIYHAHLDEIEDGKNKSNRADNLLFFTLKGEDAYFIDILPHPKGKDWFQKRLLETIYDNWKHLLTILPDGTDVINGINDSDVHNAAKSSFIAIKVRDAVVVPTNFGVASSGDSTEAVRKLNFIFNNLVIWEMWLKDNEHTIMDDLMENEAFAKPLLPFDYELIIENNYCVAYEKNNSFKIEMFRLP